MGLLSRIFPKIEWTPTCWRWTGAHVSKGYGSFWLDGKAQPAHRVVYELVKGKIPEGLHLDHLCRNRWCVNPEHLEPVTLQENNRRRDEARRARA